jgi:hypothetical protein
MNEPTNPDPATDQNPEAPTQGSPEPKAQAPDCEHCPFRIKAMEDAGKTTPPQGSGRRRLIDEIKALDIPARCKAELALLCARAKELGIQAFRFLRRHRHLGEAAVLGAFVAYALCFIPWIGGFLALVALGLSLASGVVRELREDLAALFAAEMPAQA